MARLLRSVRARLTTDFALLSAAQDGVERPDAWCLANSMPGAIGMVCGTKYADVDIRLERWDAAPRADLDGWEDRDELPFEELDGAGPLKVAGFEPADAPGLVIDGVGRARVRVQAAGRHRYGYGDGFDGAHDQPERWLLQLWPDPDRLDGLAGEPRRIAGPLPFTTTSLRGEPWAAALHAWDQTGWAPLLLSVEAFRGIKRALQQARRPVVLDQLPALATQVERLIVEGQPSMQMPLPSTVAGHPADSSHTDLLATAAGMDITTFGDLVTAMLRVRLLTQTAHGEVTPNPAPPPVWDVLELPDKVEQQLRFRALQADYRAVHWDLFHLLLWAPDQRLRARPRQVAVRLSVPVDQVLGGLRQLAASGRIVTVPELTAIDPDDTIVVSRPQR